MRKLVHLAAPAALLALAAAGTASAEPRRLDEGRLADVAAGQEVVPSSSFSATSVNTTSTATEFSSLESVSNRIGQTMNGMSINNNYSTAVNSAGVAANGNAIANIAGSVANLGGIAGGSSGP